MHRPWWTHPEAPHAPCTVWRFEEKQSSLAPTGMSGTWEPSASRLPIMSSVAGFGVNGPQRGSANMEPLLITAASTFDFSTRAKLHDVARSAWRHRLSDWEWEEGCTAFWST